MVARSIQTIAATILALGFSPAAHAQPDQYWTGVSLSGAPVTDSRLLLWLDGQARFRDGAGDLEVSVIRPGIGWRVSPKLDVYVGVASITQHGDGGDVEEQRLWQQANYHIADIQGGRLSGRTRLEQRVRDTGDDTGWRLRQSFRYGRPIDGTPLGLVVSNEVLVAMNQTDWGQQDGFDQNRLFLGVSWQAQPRVRIEGGYLNQRINLKDDVTRDNLSVNMFVTF